MRGRKVFLGLKRNIGEFHQSRIFNCLFLFVLLLLSLWMFFLRLWRKKIYTTRKIEVRRKLETEKIKLVTKLASITLNDGIRDELLIFSVALSIFLVVLILKFS